MEQKTEKKPTRKYSDFGLDDVKRTADKGSTGPMYCPFDGWMEDFEGPGHYVEKGFSFCFSNWCICPECVKGSFLPDNSSRWYEGECFKCKQPKPDCYHDTKDGDIIQICRDCMVWAADTLKIEIQNQNNSKAMKLQINSIILSEALGKIVPTILSNPVIPILKDVVFRLEGNRLDLTVTDTGTTIVTTIPAAGKSDGSITVDGKIILGILKALPDQLIQIETKSSGVIINTNNGVYELPKGDPDDFPGVPEIEGNRKFTLLSGVLKNAIDRILFAVSSDELRPALNSVYVNLEQDKTTFVSTDTMRLAEYEVGYKSGVEDSLLIPVRSIVSIKPFLLTTGPDVEITLSDNHVCLHTGETTIFCRLTDVKFPNYKAVIPKKSDNVLICNRAKLLSSVKRVRMLGADILKLSFKHGSMISVSAQDVSLGRAGHEAVECDYNGEQIEVGVSGKAFVEILSVVDADQICIEVTAAAKPVLIRPDDEKGYTILLMTQSITN